MWTESHPRWSSSLVSALPAAPANTWCLWSPRAAGRLACPQPGLAQTKQYQTGGQPEWGLMRLKPHQRLVSVLTSAGYLSWSSSKTVPLPVITPCYHTNNFPSWNVLDICFCLNWKALNVDAVMFYVWPWNFNHQDFLIGYNHRNKLPQENWWLKHSL